VDLLRGRPTEQDIVGMRSMAIVRISLVNNMFGGNMERRGAGFAGYSGRGNL
jgi:hypothetical protein